MHEEPETKEKFKFYFKGRYFTNENEFWKKVNDWPLEHTTDEELKRFFSDIHKDFLINLELYNYPIKNGEMALLFSEFFIKFVELMNNKNKPIMVE